jgi:Helix-turn-helix
MPPDVAQRRGGLFVLADYGVGSIDHRRGILALLEGRSIKFAAVSGWAEPPLWEVREMMEGERPDYLTPLGRFGVEVREVRRCRKMTQKALGLASGYSEGYVSKVEKGTMMPSENSRKRVISLFKQMGYSRDYASESSWATILPGSRHTLTSKGMQPQS